MRLAVAALALVALAGAAHAETGKLGVELNDLQEGEGTCRAVFVVSNGLGRALDKLTLRVVTFDGKGKASLFLSLDVGALPVAKTRILRFDLGEKVACADVSRMVLDDVTACAGGEMTPATCLAAVDLKSRVATALDF